MLQMTKPYLHNFVEKRQSGQASFIDLKKQFLKNSIEKLDIIRNDQFEVVDHGKHVTAMDLDPKGRL